MENVTEMKHGAQADRFVRALDTRTTSLDSDRARETITKLSHEIRSPLGTILGFTEILLTRTESLANERAWLRNIHHSAHGLLATLENLLDLAALQAGVLRLEPATFPLSRLLDEISRSPAEEWTSKGVAIELRCEPVPDLEADLLRVRQILRQLIDNAVRFSPDNATVTVRVSEIVLIEPGGETYVRIDVIDRGTGIDALEWDRIFVEFERGSNAANTETGGLGLGLALVRQLVELHGGTVWVESEPGRGSRFSVVLPARFRGTGA